MELNRLLIQKHTTYQVLEFVGKDSKAVCSLSNICPVELRQPVEKKENNE